MSKKVDQILENLRKGTPLRQIKADFKSQSQLYEAFRLYFAETEENIEERQNTISTLTSTQTSLEQKIEQLDAETNKLKKAEDQLQLRLANLEETHKGKREKLDGIEKRLSELEKKGVTLELVTRIHTMELKCKEDLLERVKTASEHTAARKELAELTKEKTNITEEIAELKRTREGLVSDIQSQKNLLDERKRKTQTFQKAVQITVSFFLDGYNTKDLERLKDSLKLIGVKGDPKLSIDRLVRGLEDAKTLVALENAIREAEKQLNSLNANISVAKGELESYKTVVLKVLNEVKDKAIREIRDTSKHAIVETGKVRIEGEKSVEETGKFWKKELKAIDQMVLNNLNTANKTIDDIVKQFKAEFEKTTNIREDAIKYEHLMKHAYCLLGVLKFPKAITEVPLTLICQLADRILLYVETFFGDEWTTPSKTVSSRESGFSAYRSYRLPVLVLWLKEELEKRTLKNVKKRTAGD